MAVAACRYRGDRLRWRVTSPASRTSLGSGRGAGRNTASCEARGDLTTVKWRPCEGVGVCGVDGVCCRRSPAGIAWTCSGLPTVARPPCVASDADELVRANSSPDDTASRCTLRHPGGRGNDHRVNAHVGSPLPRRRSALHSARGYRRAYPMPDPQLGFSSFAPSRPGTVVAVCPSQLMAACAPSSISADH